MPLGLLPQDPGIDDSHRRRRELKAQFLSCDSWYTRTTSWWGPSGPQVMGGRWM